MNKIIISLIEGLYILFMFNYFKTNYDINNPFEYIFTGNTYFLKHPISTGNYENKICPLGNLVGFLLLFWFIIRNYFNSHLITKLNNLILGITLIIAFILNWNAFLYFLPLFLFDIYYYQKI